MGNQFQKHKLWIVIASGFIILAAILALIRYSQTSTEALDQPLDTPSLIQLAYDRGEITKDERLLYLAYALYEPESLPVRYKSRIGWFGDVEVRELDEVIKDPLVVCSMSPNIRTEFQRLLETETLCTQNPASQELETPSLIALVECMISNST
jgi:hypothetical protein